MPYISVKTNVALKSDKILEIKSLLGKAMSIIGKSEQWLMVSIEDGYALWFSGTDEPAAIAEVSQFGFASASVYNQLTAEVTKIISSATGVVPERIYVKYDEIKYWGFGGRNL